MDNKGEEIHMHISTQIRVTENMGLDNDSPAENVHIMTSGTLGQWMKENKYMHLSTQTHILLKTWDKTTTHPLRMYKMQ